MVTAETGHTAVLFASLHVYASCIVLALHRAFCFPHAWYPTSCTCPPGDRPSSWLLSDKGAVAKERQEVQLLAWLTKQAVTIQQQLLIISLLVICLDTGCPVFNLSCANFEACDWSPSGWRFNLRQLASLREKLERKVRNASWVWVILKMLSAEIYEKTEFSHKSLQLGPPKNRSRSKNSQSTGNRLH